MSRKKIVRRFWRSDNVTTVMPEVTAVAIDSSVEGGTLEMTYATLLMVALGSTFLDVTVDLRLLQEMDVEFLDERLPSLYHTTWMEEGLKKQPGTFCSPYQVPPSDLLVDETFTETGRDRCQFKAVAYKLAGKVQKNCNVEYVEVPVDQIDLLTSMVGTLTITIDQGSYTVEAGGLFAEDKHIVAAIRRLEERKASRG